MKILFLIFILLFYCSVQFVNAGPNLRTSFAPFQKLTNQFLFTIQPNDTILNTTANLLINASKSGVNSDYNFYVNLYWQPYVGYIILLIIGILFLVFFPLVGCCFCCCRVCCKRCGANPKNASTYNMKKKRIAFNILLFLLTTLILIGAIVAMASNFILLETVSPINETNDNDGNLFYNVNSSISMINNYISTVGQNWSGPGLSVISSLFINISTIFSPVVPTFIDSFKNEIKFDNLKTNAHNFSSVYQNIQTTSINLSSVSNKHQDETKTFNTSLNEIKQSINSSLTNDACANINSSCENVRSQLINLDIGFNSSNINYTFDINAVNVTNQYNVTNLQNAVNQVTNTIENILNDANKTFNEKIDSFINNLNSTNMISNLNNTLNGYIASGINYINKLRGSFFSISFDKKPIAYGGIYDYFKYVFYGFCALISIILLVVLLFYIGLCFGICGAPNFEDASKCNKGTGSSFLMASVAISFLFGFLIMFITMIMFMSGGLVITEFCRYLNTTNINQIQIVDSIINQTLPNNLISFGPFPIPKLNFYQSIKIGCKNSSDLISAFQIPSSFIDNVTSYIYSSFIESQLNQTITNIGNYNMSQINTTSLDDNISKIQNIVNQLVQAISPVELTELNKPVTKLSDAKTFQDSLQILIRDLGNQNKTDALKAVNNSAINFQNNITQMQSIQTQYYQLKTHFDNTVLSLNITLENLNNSLNLLKQAPSTARNKAIKNIQTALTNIVKSQINRTIYDIVNATGDCKGATDLLDSVVNTICVVFFGPFNNLWMGMGWFLLFIIPAIIFAVKLNGIYRISHIETESAAYNQAYMSSNQYLSKNNVEMIRMSRPQKA